ncbi:MAG: 4-hydroxybenzoate octaprenyltransferase [Litorimonas sp.]
MVEVIPDSSKTHWVNRAPIGIRPYLQLSRLDRPVGYWLLALPGWIGLSFAGLSHGLAWMDLVLAVLILIGAIAMRGAGCTYNDIVDQDLDAQVERTALRPLPAGTVTTRQAWKWTFAQIAVGFLIWLCLPLLAKGIALLALPLVVAYPFMKRITWFPQVWLGMTFNWAVLVAYAAKTGTVSLPLFILYLGLIFWTVGYDTIYACQDMEDDAMVGIKSTARKFGGRVKLGVGVCYTIFLFLATWAWLLNVGTTYHHIWSNSRTDTLHFGALLNPFNYVVVAMPALHLFWQVTQISEENPSRNLMLFKSNVWQAVFWLFSSIGFWLLVGLSV